MVNAKFKKIAIFKLIVTAILGPFLVLYIPAVLSSVFFDYPIAIKKSNFSFSVLMSIILFICVFTTIPNLLRNITKRVFSIEINKEKNTIFFKNLITSRATMYTFSDFESYYDRHFSGRSGVYDESYLVRNGKVEKIISSFYYSNYDELKAALCSIKYEGLKNK